MPAGDVKHQRVELAWEASRTATLRTDSQARAPIPAAQKG